MSATLDAKSIAAKPGWRALREFVEAWHPEPLGVGGASEEELVAAELRLGCALPETLREWYGLVDRRLTFTGQDSPVELDSLCVKNGRLPIWWENQSNWSLDVELDDPDPDPFCIVDVDEPVWRRRARLSEVLLGMVVGDTMMGVATNATHGALGLLRKEVVGGWFADLGIPEGCLTQLPALDLFLPPADGQAFRGHPRLVIRPDFSMWMAADEEALMEARAVLKLDEIDGPGTLAVVLGTIAEKDQEFISRLLDRREPDFHTMARLFLSRGRPHETLAMQFKTREPDAAVEWLRARLAPATLAKLEAGYAPPGFAGFRRCWPLNAREFRAPSW